MIIKTERLILREMTEDDFDALYRILADPEIMQHYPNTFDESVCGTGSRGIWNDIGFLASDCGQFV